MEEAAIPEKTQVEIPYSVVEYTAVFRRPILEAWPAIALIVSAVLEALEPHGFKLDGVETKTHTEKLNDYAVVFRRTPPGVTLTVQLGKLTILAENLDWGDAEQFLVAAHAGIGVVLTKAKAEIQSQQLGLGIHIQIKTKPRLEVAAPLLSPTALKLLDGEMKFPGIILQRGKATLIVDGSLAFANGLFVRINREHAADVTLERIAEILRADEERLFEVLGLEGAL
ncbi:MAG: hypothetical protein ACLPND_14960 [Candidatus Korobacteraceae bacterium]